MFAVQTQLGDLSPSFPCGDGLPQALRGGQAGLRATGINARRWEEHRALGLGAWSVGLQVTQGL